jgi:hypothetical protein
MKKTILLYLSIILFLFSCVSGKKSSKTTFILDIPPGTQKIADNLYIDQTEIRNVDYLEFLHWTKKVYGESSAEYLSIYPDTTVWSSVSNNYTSLDTYYLKHPTSRKLSVLGVSNKQAKEFAKWRSDRVMEFILIRDKIIKYDPMITKDSFFTIEKYYSGQYKNVKPSPDYLDYPEYRLLDPAQNTFTGFKTICTYKKWEFQ